MQTPIRQFLEKRSDQCLNCLLFYLHFFDKLHYQKNVCLNLRVITANIKDVRKVRTFAVIFFFPIQIPGVLATVDATVEPTLAQQYNVRGYPSCEYNIT